MSIQISDRQGAVVAALGLVGLAAVVIFWFHPGGFETQIGWFLLLLPGEFVAAPVSDQLTDYPRAERIVFWTMLIGLSFLWYWGISYTILRIFRAVAHTIKPQTASEAPSKESALDRRRQQG